MSKITVNMNNSNDPNYRYKITPISVRYGGGGQCTVTYLTNLEQVTSQIGHPKKILLKYLAQINGTNEDEKLDSLKGTIGGDIIQEGLFSYLQEFVFCSKCNIPECNLEVKKDRKKCLLYKKCSGCGAELEYISNKKTNKITSIIIKEINNGIKFEKMKGVVEDTDDDFSINLFTDDDLF